MYELTGVTKHYPKGRTEPVVALESVTLTIADGEWLAVQGQTGHGKSTLLQMLGGLDRPTAGTVKLHGDDLAAMREGRVTQVRADSIGFVFQTYNLIPTLNAQENVEAGLAPLGLKPAKRRERAADALESVGLTGRRGHLPSELSGGQQQRVAVARALAKQPKVLLADEPTGNLDQATKEEIVALLKRLWRKHKLTFVLVTHDTSVASQAQRVAVMHRGRLSIRGDGGQPSTDAAPEARRRRKRR